MYIYIHVYKNKTINFFNNLNKSIEYNKQNIKHHSHNLLHLLQHHVFCFSIFYEGPNYISIHFVSLTPKKYLQQYQFLSPLFQSVPLPALQSPPLQPVLLQILQNLMVLPGNPVGNLPLIWKHLFYWHYFMVCQFSIDATRCNYDSLFKCGCTSSYSCSCICSLNCHTRFPSSYSLSLPP